MRLAQLDRAFGYGPKGRGFESSQRTYEASGIVPEAFILCFGNRRKIVLTLVVGQSRIKKQKRKILVKLFV